MKSLYLGLIASVTATVASAGGVSYTPIAPAADSSGGPEGALLLLLLVGAMVVLNGGLGTSRAKTQDTEVDEDIIQRF